MADNLKILNYRTSGDSTPSASNLEYGQIAVGYKRGSEAIFIKNTDNEVVAIKPSGFTKITYANLKQLRDNEALTPGMWYRITDFVTTVANDDEARSANHPFDVIVLATDTNILQEEAFAAMPSNGDDYFKDCKLDGWKIWYCLDNDATRFQWADTRNGKGVIYRMIDEWRNDCPYDFKNVQYKRYYTYDDSPNGELIDLDGTYVAYNGKLKYLTFDEEDFKWAYTFTLIDEADEWVDYSSKKSNGDEEDLSYFQRIKKGCCEYNLIRHFYNVVSFDDVNYQVQSLNNIVLISTMYMAVSGEMLLNTFGAGNYNMTLKDNPEQNYFGDKCYDNIVGSYGNIFGNGCWSNTFGNGCSNNTFGDDCSENMFGYSGDNTFGNNCRGNTFGNNCGGNIFGNGCWSNTFGNGCSNNTFGCYCWNNMFGNDFRYNTLGNDVQYIRMLTDKVYHVNIINGTKAERGKLLAITFETEKDYSQFAGLDSDGNLQIWVEADNKKYYKVTYKQLVSLRDNKKLVPSAYYKITDFVTTVANDDEARSAEHPFDIIVLATDVNVLQEEAFAALHEGDTYFKDCKLESWKIWYCLDNDDTRFQWADTKNGKGVIYRMIDEWNNDCPYDFKNVQYKRYLLEVLDVPNYPHYASGYHLNCFLGWKGNEHVYGYDVDETSFSWAYTFSIGDLKIKDSYKDISVSQIDEYTVRSGFDGNYGNNVIHTTFGKILTSNAHTHFCYLNNIVFIKNTDNNQEIGNSEIFGGSFCMTIVGDNIKIGSNSSNNLIIGERISAKGRLERNSICGVDSSDISFGSNVNHNFLYNARGAEFGNECEGNYLFNCSNIVFNNFGSNITLSESANILVQSGAGSDINGVSTPFEEVGLRYATIGCDSDGNTSSWPSHSIADRTVLICGTF